MGSVVFWMVYGLGVVNVLYDDWLLTGGDLTQHYLGWCLFRKSPWEFPIGLTPEYAWPYDVSAMYADVIPVCAVFFKLLSPFLPDTFQYFGLWGMLCYILQGGLAAVLLLRFIPSPWLSGILSVFFIVGSPLMYRMFIHTALGTQWILLLALLLLFCKQWFSVGRIAWRMVWGMVACLCVWVHGYFVPMVFLVMLACLYTHWWKYGEKKETAVLLAVFLTGVLGSMWVLGAFSAPLASEGGLGTFSANLDTFFNPVFVSMSRFMPVYPIFEGQIDGFAYLGLGGIILLVLSIVKTLCLKHLREMRHTLYAPAVLLCFLCILGAVLPRLSFHDHVLFTIDYPDFLMPLLLIFRGNGRFIWLPYYLLMLFSIVQVTKTVNGQYVRKLKDNLSGFGENCSKLSKIGVLTALLMLVVQMTDYSIIIKDIRRDVDSGLGNYIGAALTGEKHHADGQGRTLLNGFGAIDNIVKNFKYVVYTDYRYVYRTETSLMISYYACKNDVKLGAFYLARMPSQHLQQEQEKLIGELRAGRPRDDTLYIIADPDRIDEYKGLFYHEVNGLWLGSSRPLE